MCIGEKRYRSFSPSPSLTPSASFKLTINLGRTLTVPPEYGYGDRGVGPIPGGATLGTKDSHLYEGVDIFKAMGTLTMHSVRDRARQHQGRRPQGME